MLLIHHQVVVEVHFGVNRLYGEKVQQRLEKNKSEMDINFIVQTNFIIFNVDRYYLSIYIYPYLEPSSRNKEMN